MPAWKQKQKLEKNNLAYALALSLVTAEKVRDFFIVRL